MSRKTFTFVICLMLAICNLPGQQTDSNIQVWFDIPLPNTVVLPPNPCLIITHGASPVGVAAFELFVNGNVVANIPNTDSKETLATFIHDCPALQPRENIIEVRAQDSADAWSDPSQTTVILAQPDSITETPTPLANEPADSTPTPTLTLTATPSPTFTLTFTPTPQLTGGVTIERVSTNEVILVVAVVVQQK